MPLPIAVAVASRIHFRVRPLPHPRILYFFSPYIMYLCTVYAVNCVPCTIYCTLMSTNIHIIRYMLGRLPLVSSVECRILYALCIYWYVYVQCTLYTVHSYVLCIIFQNEMTLNLSTCIQVFRMQDTYFHVHT